MLTTREALLAKGREAFASRGYAGSRLADIAAEANLTTGAFYRHFSSKLHFFTVLYAEYGAALLDALDTAPSLNAQIVAWLEVARQHQGVVRASQELLRAGSSHLEPAHELRSDCARLLAKRLSPPGSEASTTRGAPLMVVDIVTQYALTEAAEWIPRRAPEAVATQLERLVLHGLYSA